MRQRSSVVGVGGTPAEDAAVSASTQVGEEAAVSSKSATVRPRQAGTWNSRVSTKSRTVKQLTLGPDASVTFKRVAPKSLDHCRRATLAIWSLLLLVVIGLTIYAFVLPTWVVGDAFTGQPTYLRERMEVGPFRQCSLRYNTTADEDSKACQRVKIGDAIRAWAIPAVFVVITLFAILAAAILFLVAAIRSRAKLVDWGKGILVLVVLVQLCCAIAFGMGIVQLDDPCSSNGAPHCGLVCYRPQFDSRITYFSLCAPYTMSTGAYVYFWSLIILLVSCFLSWVVLPVQEEYDSTRTLDPLDAGPPPARPKKLYGAQGWLQHLLIRNTDDVPNARFVGAPTEQMKIKKCEKERGCEQDRKDRLDSWSWRYFPFCSVALAITVIIIYGVKANQEGCSSTNIALQCPAAVSSRLSYLPECRNQAWRFLTYVLMHQGIVHLVLNVLGLLLLCTLVEILYGSWRIFTVMIIGAVAGAMASSIIDREVDLVGCSSIVYAIVGAQLMGVWYNWHMFQKQYRYLLWLIPVVILLAELVVAIIARYTSPGLLRVSYVAHIVSFVVGMCAGALVLRSVVFLYATKDTFFKQFYRPSTLALILVRVFAGVVLVGLLIATVVVHTSGNFTFPSDPNNVCN
eukprot:m.100366 g.100366  ORF g.100366 m.100366 type:complete len:628 (+) comp13170_c0_seq1:410-2293(+)